MSVERASAPDTLLTANQPMPPTIALSPAGSALPTNPKPTRESTIMGTPAAGPREESRPWVSDPRAVPTRIPRNAPRKPRLNALTASTPTKIVANSRFGEHHVQNSWRGFPCRSASGMNSAPPGSTATTRTP